jgi:hypothetical protein
VRASSRPHPARSLARHASVGKEKPSVRRPSLGRRESDESSQPLVSRMMKTRLARAPSRRHKIAVRRVVRGRQPGGRETDHRERVRAHDPAGHQRRAVPFVVPLPRRELPARAKSSFPRDQLFQVQVSVQGRHEPGVPRGKQKNIVRRVQGSSLGARAPQERLLLPHQGLALRGSRDAAAAAAALPARSSGAEAGPPPAPPETTTRAKRVPSATATRARASAEGRGNRTSCPSRTSSERKTKTKKTRLRRTSSSRTRTRSRSPSRPRCWTRLMRKTSRTSIGAH